MYILEGVRLIQLSPRTTTHWKQPVPINQSNKRPAHQPRSASVKRFLPKSHAHPPDRIFSKISVYSTDSNPPRSSQQDPPGSGADAPEGNKKARPNGPGLAQANVVLGDDLMGNLGELKPRIL